MSDPSKKHVQVILGEFHSRIRAVVDRAWAEWRAVAGFRSENAFGPMLYPRTVANYVFDAIARHAIAEFGDDPSVDIKIEPQTIKLFFKGAVLGRFKKGDENKLGQNVTTQAALAFADANEILPGLPPETVKVEFIWLANEIQTRLEHVLVVRRDNDTLLWDYELEATGEVVPFPDQPSGPVGVDDDTDSSEEKLVKPKVPSTEETVEE